MFTIPAPPLAYQRFLPISYLLYRGYSFRTDYLLVSAKIKSKIEIVSLILIISGGLGNLVDRALNGHVVDYIQALPAFIDFPVFNFADCLVTVGSFLLIGFLLYDIFKEFKNSKKELPHAESAVSEENALPAETGEISEKADESEESESVSEKTSDETA